MSGSTIAILLVIWLAPSLAFAAWIAWCEWRRWRCRRHRSRYGPGMHGAQGHAVDQNGSARLLLLHPRCAPTRNAHHISTGSRYWATPDTPLVSPVTGWPGGS